MYGRTDLTDEQAKAIYDQKSSVRKQKVDSTRAKSQDRIKQIDEDLSKITSTTTPLEQKVLDFQKQQALEKANKRVSDAWLDLVLSLPKMDVPGAAKLFGQDIPDILTTAKERWTSGESLNWKDGEKLALAGIGIIVGGAALLPVGVGGSLFIVGWGGGALLVSGAIELASAYSAVNSLKDPGGKVIPDVDAYRRQLEHQRQKEIITLEYLKLQEARLGVGYLGVQK